MNIDIGAIGLIVWGVLDYFLVVIGERGKCRKKVYSAEKGGGLLFLDSICVCLYKVQT